MADQPVAPEEPFAKALANETTLSGNNIAIAIAILTAPEVPTGGGGGGTSAHGFVT